MTASPSDDLAVLIRDEIQKLFTEDVLARGELGLVRFTVNEAYLIAGAFALWFRFENEKIRVHYVDFDEKLHLRTFNLEVYLKQFQQKDESVFANSPWSPKKIALKIAFVRLAVTPEEFWAGAKQWLNHDWLDANPAEPMLSTLKSTWALE